MDRALLTVGHGRADRRRLAGLFIGAGIERIVDVRRFPASRGNPDVRREALAGWLPEVGIAYRWSEVLGGRRQRQPGQPEMDLWWTVPAFRAYAAHTRTANFRMALDELLVDVATATTAIMCSESLWWRCHRRLIADVVCLSRGVPVRHLLPDGRLTVHHPAAGARMQSDGTVIWAG